MQIRAPWNTWNEVLRENSQYIPVIILTGATKTYIPGVTGHVDALLNLTVIKKTYLIGNLHVADSLEVSFAKFARAVFRNPIFDL